MDGTTSYIQPLYIPSAGEVHHSGVATQHEKSLLSSHRNSTATGKLVLQDLEGVIEEAEAFGLEEKIVPMKHDFFTKQPVIGIFSNTTKIFLRTSLGARAYYTFLSA